MSKTVLVLVFIGAFAAPAFTQVDGRLTGLVVDPSEAAIPNAAVRVYLPAGKTPMLTMLTTSAGIFDFTAVRSGIYRLEVAAPGFTTVALNNVSIDPVRQTTLPPIHLEISTRTQVLEVTASAASVETSSVEVNSTVTQSQVLNLPVLDRQVNNLFYTQPGVNSNGSADTSINGVRAQNTNVTLDGINIQDNFIRINGLDYLPNKLTIGEVQAITISSSNADTAIGGNASVISLSSPSGSNGFHGSGYWYNRNSALSANDWFNNTDGVQRPFLNLNQFGATLGGPVKKDKLFFYSAYETYDYHSTTPTTTTILTPSARKGLFTYRANGNGAIQTFDVLANPGAPAPLSIDPVVTGLLAQVPLVGNSAQVGDGLNTTGYQFNARANQRRDSILGKVDYNLSTKHVFSGTYRWNRDNDDRPDVFTGFNVVSPVSNQNRASLFSASWRWTPTATLTNQLRGGGNLATAPFDVAGSLPATLVTGTLFTNPQNTFLPQGRTANVYSVQDNAAWIHRTHTISFGFQTQQVRVAPYDYGGIVPTYTLGVFSANQPYGYGTGDIPGANAVDTNTANALLGTLAGLVQSASQSYNVTSQASGFVPGAPSRQNLSFNSYALYVTDSWKLRHNLNAVLGVRYDYFTPVQERNGLLIQPQLINNDPAATLLGNATLTFQGNHLYHSQKNNFAPNVGLAWSPLGETFVLRAGYSIAYAQDDILEAVLSTVTANSGLTGTSAITNASGVVSAPPPLTAPQFQIPITTQQNFVNTGGNNVQGLISPNLKTPYVQQWNVTAEKKWKSMIFDAAYLGNHAVGLLRQIDFNQVNIYQSTYLQDFKSAYNNGILSLNAGLGFNPAFNASIPGSVTLPFFGSLPGGGVLSNATVRSEILSQQVGTLAQLYQQNNFFPANQPGFSYFPNPLSLYSSLLSNFSQSTYNGLQLEARKRTAGGMQFQVSYVFSKTFSDTSVERGLDALLNNGTPSIERARAPWDLTHAFKLNHYIPIPAGRGHRVAARGFNWLLGDWALSGFVTIQSGAPVSILSSRGTLNRSARSGENTAVTAQTLGELQSISGLFVTGNGPYYINPSAISANGTGAAPDGSAPFAGQVFFNPSAGTVGTLQRRLLSGPWFDNYNLAVEKTIRIGERQHVDFRADSYNLFNHPTFFAGDQNINSVNFGKITQQFYSADGVGPRLIQFGLSYRF
ncbi:MAG: TonB-dependent receptor [Acidobacteriia bacterium]|nr:TonB-dependent receptor [Terriglobia bacterium]